ncbi:MAG: rod shape-determining protein MreC [Myxococcota bacterium]
MLSILRRYRELLVVMVLMALPLLLFLAGNREQGQRNVVDRAVLTVFSPVQKAVFWVVDGVQDLWFGYVYLVGVREHNEELRRENLRLAGRVGEADELRLENERLRRILGFKDRVDGEPVAAPIIAIGARQAFSRSWRLGRGTGDGISVGNAVVTPEGVGEGWADVMSIADPNSAVPALASRSRARATVQGTGRLDRALLDHAARTDDIVEGDLLVTAGTGGIYPKGLPIGRVAGLRRRPHGLFLQAEVVPVVDLARVEEVLVLTGNRESAEVSEDLAEGGSP